MKIISFQVDGLFGHRTPIRIDFKSDIHVISGKNGAGKTTILKLVWYFISGNLEKALIEVPFKSATLETDIYILNVKVKEEQDTPFETTLTYKDRENFIDIDENIVFDIDLEEINPHIRHILTKFIGSSYFFPTFRNIEGGFNTEKYNIKHELIRHLLINNSQKNPNNIDLISDFKTLSNKISNENHRFIASVSSSNINDVLISRYAEIMSLIQPYQSQRRELLTELFKHISLPESDEDTKIEIKSIQKKLSNIDDSVNTKINPLKRFHESIVFFLKQYEFHFGQSIQYSLKSEEIKDKDDIIFADGGIDIVEVSKPPRFDISILSAGEKQILTFIGYNSFYNNTIFFIDEPEISLHADWQRILFRILMKQNPTNQFIITTQSPFIGYLHYEV